MAKVPVSCPHCQRVTNVDTDKLPDRPVSFQCPGCKGKVPVDPAALLSGEQPAAAEAEKAPVPSSGRLDELGEVPPGTTFPNAMVHGEDEATIARLGEVLEPHECGLTPLESVLDLLSMTDEEIPTLLFLVTGPVGKPPYRRLQPLVSLSPLKRRRAFVVLVAPDVRTMDGGAAFFYNVNLLLNTADVDRAPAVLFDALDHHRRLYQMLLRSLEARANV